MAYRKTLTQLRTMVRDRVDEPTAAFWTSLQIDRYLNAGKDRTVLHVKRLAADYFLRTLTSTDGSVTAHGETYTTASFAIAVGTRDYTLPHDFGSMKTIEVVTSGYEQIRFTHRDLAHPEMRAAMAVVDNQTPGGFDFDIIGERTMRIAPKSSIALDLRITYEQAFADLSADADELTMPHPLYLAVVEFATAGAMLQDGNPNAASHEALAKQIIEDFFAGHSRQMQDPEVAVGYLEGW